MNPPSFDALMQELAGVVAGRRLDAALAAQLNAEHGVGSPLYRRVRAACIEGVADGWLCAREGGGIRYGRACKPSPELHGFSVDVVDMNPSLSRLKTGEHPPGESAPQAPGGTI